MRARYRQPMPERWQLAPWALLLAGMLALAAPARATVVMTTTLSNIPQDDNVTLLNIGTGSGNGLLSSATGYFDGANSVTFAGTAGIYHGTSGVAAAPTLNGSAITANWPSCFAAAKRASGGAADALFMHIAAAAAIADIETKECAQVRFMFFHPQPTLLRWENCYSIRSAVLRYDILLHAC